MGRPRKCRICGYRFHGNEDICPECFTAREDDISCAQFGGEDHSHNLGNAQSSDSDIFQEFKEKSFIDEQRSDEANDPIPSSTYGGSQGTPPPTYAQQSYNNNRSQPARNTYSNGRPMYNNPFTSRSDKLNALRNGMPVGGQHGQFRYGPNGQQTFYPGGNKPKNTAAVTVVVVVFICIFFVPVIMGIVSSIGNSMGSKSKSKTTTRSKINVEISTPDFSMPDVSIPDMSDFDARQASGTVEGRYKVYLKFIKKFVPFSKSDAGKLFTDEQWASIRDGDVSECRLVTFDLSLVDLGNTGCSFVPEKSYMACGKLNGESICNSFLIDYRANDNGSVSCTCLIPADCKRTTAFIALKMGDGKTEEMCEVIVRDINYDVVKDSYGLEQLDQVLGSLSSDDTAADASSKDKKKTA
ncbi:MAG: hypothetical protein IKN66_00305 [Ruminococcus sp.]|nr:hypothetical protein [Ruminococcus sp.]